MSASQSPRDGNHRTGDEAIVACRSRGWTKSNGRSGSSKPGLWSVDDVAKDPAGCGAAAANRTPAEIAPAASGNAENHNVITGTEGGRTGKGPLDDIHALMSENSVLRECRNI